MALKLRELNYEDVFALKGGFDAWKRAGHPVEQKESAIILPPPT